MSIHGTESNGSEWDEIEARSLIAANKAPMRRTSQSAFRWRNIQVVLLLAFCALVSLFKEDLIALLIMSEEVEEDIKIPVEELRTLVLDGKKDFDQMLKDDYGEYAEEIFDTVSVMGYFKSISDLSRQRLKRRIKMKIIESQVSDGITSFTWAVGGHSAAAGHGNLFDQAYGSVIEQSLGPVFGSLGIKFYAKNYAMGGTKSGPEIAMCMEAVFGNSIDILSWDFGMTDGQGKERYNLWTQRAGVHPTRPVLFAYGGRQAHGIHAEVEAAGGAGFVDNFGSARSIIPDSDGEGVDPSKLPSGIQNYLCGGHHIETGEPCKDHKWDTEKSCPKIGYQTSWHNGWKDHLFVGRLSAAFVLENFLEALNELSDNPIGSDLESAVNSTVLPDIKPEISSRYLMKLQDHEQKDRFAFETSTVPLEIFGDNVKSVKDTNFTNFQRFKSVCRTAVLPSQSRYDGLVTGTSIQSNYIAGGRTDYKDEGYDFSKLRDVESEDGITDINLVYNIKNNRLICDKAEIDFKDTFFVRYADKWMKMTLPNDAEASYYKQESLGDKLIMLCTVAMDWGKTGADYVSITEMVNATMTGDDSGIIVNGVKATNATHINDDRCYLLKNGEKEGQDGYYFKPSDEGRFEIQFRVPRDGNLYLSSVILL